MNKKNRQSKLIELLKVNHFLTTNQLSENLSISESTINRDLTELSIKNVIKKVHGGAILIDTNKIDVDYLIKLENNIGEQNKIDLANVAKQYISNNLTLFIDSSSTCLHLIPLLNEFYDLRIVTNGVLTATLLSQYTDHEVNILGGRVNQKKFTINSGPSFEQLFDYHFDCSFISCRGFNENDGLTENSEGEARIKRGLIPISEKIIALVTEEKIETTCFYQSLKIDELTTIIK